jgi:GntR family transcriptional regulator
MTFWKRSLVNKSTGTPLYRQLCDVVIQAIKDGRLLPNERIPSDRELCEELGMSRMTIRHAMAELVREGWLHSQTGKGTFVRGPKMGQLQQTLIGFTQNWRSRGYETHARVLVAQLVPATATLAEEMRLPAHEAVVKLERVRYINDEPISIEAAHVPYALAPGILEHDFSHESLYEVLREQYHHRLAWAHQIVEADMPSPREASLLTIARTTPVLRGTRTVVLADEQVIEYNQAVYRGDRYRYETMLFEGGWPSEIQLAGLTDERRSVNISPSHEPVEPSTEQEA